MSEEAGISTASVEATVADLESNGKTVMLTAADGRLQGIIAVADTVKESSAAAIAALQAQGLRVVMLTGDNQRTAEAIAKVISK